VDKFQGNSDFRIFRDWREVIVPGDVDASMNNTPDHRQVPISLAAARAGKHVLAFR
jgi:predicted dehydrogenase